MVSSLWLTRVVHTVRLSVLVYLQKVRLFWAISTEDDLVEHCCISALTAINQIHHFDFWLVVEGHFGMEKCSFSLPTGRRNVFSILKLDAPELWLGVLCCVTNMLELDESSLLYWMFLVKLSLCWRLPYREVFWRSSFTTFCVL